MDIKHTKERSVASEQRKTVVADGMQSEKRRIDRCAREWVSGWLPTKNRLSSRVLDEQPTCWEPDTNYVIPCKPTAEAGMLAVTLAEEFARAGGHVIWIGTTADLHRMSDELMFKIAGLELPAKRTEVQLNVIEYLNLMDARGEMMNMWIDFCNVDDCGDETLEQDFIASMSSFEPTLIIIDASIFDDQTSEPFEFLTRNTFGLHMAKQLRETNPISSVVWPSWVPNKTLAAVTNLDDAQ